MKIFFLVAFISSSFVYALSPEEKPVDQNLRNEKFVGIERMRGWDDQKKDEFYRDLNSKPTEDLSKKYPDFDSSEIDDIKKRE